MLGIPSVVDRVAQAAAAMALEPGVEPIFHEDSYGYRPGRAPLDAVAVCRERCLKQRLGCRSRHPGVLRLRSDGTSC